MFVPVLWFATPWLVRTVYGARYARATNAVRVMLLAAAVQFVFGWTKSFPVSIGRPRLRTAGQLLELTALVPLVVVLAEAYGATGAAAGILGSSLVLAAFWIDQPRAPAAAGDDGRGDGGREGARRLRDLAARRRRAREPRARAGGLAAPAAATRSRRS